MTLYFLYDVAPIFVHLLNMSITAGYVVLAILLLRLLLKKAPRGFICMMWALVAIRLIIPFSCESVWSLIPSENTVPNGFLSSTDPEIDSGIPVLDKVVNPIIPSVLPTQVNDVIEPAHEGMATLSLLWLLGMAAMLIYTAVSYIKIRSKVRESVKMTDNIYLCDRIPSPFILGIISPKIYLPSGINEDDMTYVIAHENAHLKRYDHIFKPLGYLLLTVYWFNPLLWVAYIFMCRDIELACDEKVINETGTGVKKQYSTALINCAASRRAILSCPLAFSEVGVKARIKNVLSYKKPALWVIITAVVLFVVTCICFMSDPLSDSAKLDRIIERKGYSITDQRVTEIPLTVPKDVLNDSAYTPAGQEFAENEIIAYNFEHSNIYLEKVVQSNESDGYLYFIFNISYDLPSSGTILYPLTVRENEYVSGSVYPVSDVLYDRKTIFAGAVSLRGDGPDEQLIFYVDTNAVKEADGYLCFNIFINRLSYEKCFFKGSLALTHDTVNFQFFSSPVRESMTPYEGRNVFFTRSNISDFLYTLRQKKWMDESEIDREEYIFDGKFMIDNSEVYFGYEQAILYCSDGYSTTLTEDDISYIRSISTILKS